MFTKFLALPLVLGTVLAPAARAGSEFGVSFGKKTKHGAIAFSYSNYVPRYDYAPVVHVPARVWVDAHYETRCEQVWVEGCKQKVWVAPVREWRYDHCGRKFQVELRPGYWKVVQAPGHFESRNVEVWVAGHWAANGH